jgi:type III secretory pathway component EscS
MPKKKTVTKKKTTKKSNKDIWFKQVRRSYLPCSWQGWLVELVVVILFIAAVNDAVTEIQKNTLDLIDTIAILAVLLVYATLLGVAATWIAIKKS